jgi:hypothetical protein
MKKAFCWIGPAVVVAGLCTLRADDSSPPAAPQNASDYYQTADAYVWYVEHTAAVDKDPDSAGVAAVIKSEELLKTKDPQAAADYYLKVVYDAKSHAVIRAARMELYEVYKSMGQADKALEQLQLVMTEAQ